MQNLRKKFPVLQQCIYANTAATGLMYEDLMEWRQEHDLDYLIGGSEMKMKSFANLSQVRETVGDFFNCKPHNVALVPNFTIGLNLLLEGLPQNANVLLLDSDYPSLNWPFMSRNFNTEFLEMTWDMEAKIHERITTGKFDVLAFSMIQWINGIKMDLDFVRKLKSEFPNLIIIADGTQFCGTEKFDFETSGIDILGASAYKWMLSGYGNGFYLVKDEVKERFKLKSIGNWSVDISGDSPDNIPFCKHLEPGHVDTLNFGSLQFSIQFLEGIGMDHIKNQLELLSQKAKAEFSALGLLEGKVVQRNQHSAIFNVKGNQTLFDKLTQENVVAALRGDGIRLSFHFYNTENEIDAIVDILKS
ncbi:aminotransferase class V-fold PLP-dependent enzyme [Flagellimonas flava]|nr:aminotransferase class V-fold PLP-dependent enzyme [Allomuricauda flava]